MEGGFEVKESRVVTKLPTEGLNLGHPEEEKSQIKLDLINVVNLDE